MKAVLVTAVDWYVRLHESQVSTATRIQWQQWLDADPRHAEAWARIERLQQQLGGAPAGAVGTLETARQHRRTAIKMLVLLLGAGAVSWQGYRVSPLSADYSTAVGQRRRVMLADGSRLELNTDSRVDIRFDASQRGIHLLRGEILIETAKDSRPLSVLSRDGEVRALGTRFMVRQDEAQTRVSVEAHAVEVRPAHAAQQAVRVEAGQSLNFDALKTGPLQPAASNSSAWTQGMLVAVNWRLDTFLNELSRYRPGYLGCAPEVADLRLSGAFTLDDSEAVLANLQDSLPISIKRLTRYWVRVESRNA